MGNYVYGFSSDIGKQNAEKEAIQKASASGYLTRGQLYTTEVLEDAEHKTITVRITTEAQGR